MCHKKTHIIELTFKYHGKPTKIPSVHIRLKGLAILPYFFLAAIYSPPMVFKGFSVASKTELVLSLDTPYSLFI